MSPNERKQALGEAVALHRRGEVGAAIPRYQAVLAALPGDAEALHYLGMAEVQAGNVEAGLGHLQESCAAAPASHLFAANLGKAALKAGRLDLAAKAFEQAAAINPDDYQSWNNLAGLKRRAGDSKGAFEAYRRAMELKAHPAIATNLALVAKELGRRGVAREAFARAVALNPHDVSARLQMAAMASEDGDFEGSAGWLHEALQAAPDNPRVLAAVLTQRAETPAPELLERAAAVLARPGLDEEDRARLGFGLARALQRAEDHEAAWSACAAANAIVEQRAPFDAARLEAEVEALEAVFTPERIAAMNALGGDGEGLVFIFGLPRTGTTLVEQILASHARVHGGDERPEIPGLVARLQAELPGGYPSCLAEAAPDRMRDLSDEIETGLGALAPDAARVTDKLPFNFSHLGLIAGLFPKAHLIHCQRDLRDVFISCFFTEFTEELQAFRTSPDNFAAYARLYRRLMGHWDGVLGGRIHHVLYEDLIADLDTGARQLVDTIGLDWDPACLAFNETERTVRTPSRWQVRQPIYSSSIGRWRPYAAHLGEVLSLETG